MIFSLFQLQIITIGAVNQSEESQINLKQEVTTPILKNIRTQYIGGSEDEWGGVSDIDPDGNLVVAGQTRSSDFSLIYGHQSYAGASDGMFIKYDSSGDIIFSSFFGAFSTDYIIDAKLDHEGNLVVLGHTESTFLLATEGAFNTNYTEGRQNVFLAKFDPNGDILFATYLGSGPIYRTGGLAITILNEIVVVGATTSDIFPLRNAYQSTFGGVEDGYISKFSQNGLLLFSTYFGGSGTDIINRVEINSEGDFVLYGRSDSSDFPVKNSLGDEFDGRGLDLTITKMSSDGQDIRFSTKFGGHGDDIAAGLKLDAEDNIIFGGMTSSNNFPIIGGIKNTTAGDSAFLVKISPDASTILFSTYMGGEGTDWIYSIGFTPRGNYIVTGHMNSRIFPTINPIQDAPGGGEDAFIMILSNDGSELLYSSYFGGSGNDFGWSLAVDDYHVFLSGFSDSSNLINSGRASEPKGGVDLFLSEFEINYDTVVSTTSMVSSSEQSENPFVSIFSISNLIYSMFVVLILTKKKY